MPISPLPIAPTRNMTPAAFVIAADAFMSALPILATELNQMGTLYNLATTTTSSTSILIGVGSKTFTVPSGLGFSVGMPLVLASTASPLNNMVGTVTSYSSTTLIVNVATTNGSGTFASWTISLTASSIGAGLGTNTFSGVQNFAQGADITASSTVNLTSATGNSVVINGTTPINAFILGNGMSRFLVFSGACTLVYNATTMRLNTNGVDYTTGSGDKVFVYALSGVISVSVIRANGEALAQGVVTSKIQSVAASVATNALTVRLDPTELDFRANALNTGTVITRDIPSALFVVVPSAVSLATINAQSARLAIIAIENGGTPELALANLSGGDNLDETTLIDTKAIGTTCTFTGSIAVTTGILTLSATGTGTLALGMALSGTNVASGTLVKALLTGVLGAAGSTYSTNQFTAVASTTITGCAGTGIYSTTARTGQPFRVVGFIDISETTAGTWATAPTTIQGMGGKALDNLSGLGAGQTWQNVLASRALSTTYYNLTGRPIIVAVTCTGGTTDTYNNMSVFVNGAVVCSGTSTGRGSATSTTVSAVVPHGSSYQVTGNYGVSIWSELR